MRSRPPHFRATLAAVVLVMLGAGPARAAHEIPPSVTVLAFVRPEAQRLRIVLRVPLESMRDFQFPLYGPGYLDVARAEPLVRDAARLWLLDYIDVFENGRRLHDARVVHARVSHPSDRSFTTYAAALAHVRAPRDERSPPLPWQQALVDVLIEMPVESAASRFSIRPALAHLGLRTTTVLRFLPAGGAERVLQYAGDPGLVHLDPRWHQAFFRFVQLGFGHILEGLDHLLFVLCLVIPFRKVRPLVVIVTSFTVAHSITLIASAFGLAPGALWFPPLVETLVALSILWMALENIVGARMERRWLFAFAFGLVHGFAFSFLLRESLQFAGAHVLTSLLAFNIGVELGQLAVIAAAVPLLGWLFSRVVNERTGSIILSALVAHTAWHWMTQRAAALRQFRLSPPTLDLAFLAAVLRGVMLLLILAGTVWLLFGMFRRWLPVNEAEDLRRPALPRSGARPA